MKSKDIDENFMLNALFCYSEKRVEIALKRFKEISMNFSPIFSGETFILIFYF